MTIVTNAIELTTALATAQPGDVIELAAGNYADVVLDGYEFSSAVTLRSLDPQSPAIFDTLFIKNSSFLTLDAIKVEHILEPGEPDWSAAFRIDKSDNITVVNSQVSGSADANHTNDGQGLLVLDSDNIVLADNQFHDLKTALSVGRSEHVEVRDNSFVDIRSDGLNLANVRHVTADGNTFSNFHPAFELGDHPDMIQLWNDGSYGDMSDIVISNNTLSQAEGGNVQAIFIQGAIAGANGSLPPPAHDILIEGNVIDTGAAQGIWVSNANDTTISNNTLTAADGGAGSPSIRTDHTTNATVENNTAPQIDDVGSTNLTYSGNTITAEAASGTTLEGTAGDDILMGSSGNDIISAKGGKDTAHGGDGNDRLNGDGGDDTLFGDAGNDTLNGGGGNDELHDGTGNDGFFGGGGNDRIFGEAGDDVLFGDGGNDMLNGGSRADQLHGGSGNDGFFAGGGDDLIFGDSGDDSIFADGGNVTINGGSGNDTMRGGSGADTFVFDFASGSDLILDYQDGTDRIDFSNLVSVSSLDDIVVTQSATTTTIAYFDGLTDVELMLSSTSAIVIDASDFDF